jgi:hypothetical protein
MPHYANGQRAKVGDVVVGKGYNLKADDGTLRRFVGVVLSVDEGASTCNLRVARNFRPVSVADASLAAARGNLYDLMAADSRMSTAGNFTGGRADAIAVYAVPGVGAWLTFDVEYGQVDQFLPVVPLDAAVAASGAVGADVVYELPYPDGKDVTDDPRAAGCGAGPGGIGGPDGPYRGRTGL